MRLTAGDAALPITAYDIRGQIIDVNASLRKPLLLSFFRTAACPLCSLRVWHYANKAPEWAARGLRVVAIFESTPEVTSHYCEGITIPFPQIADPRGYLFEQYGVTQSAVGAALGLWRDFANYPLLRKLRLSVIPFVGKGMFRMPADFLIRPDFTIADAHYGRDAGDHISFDRIERFAHTLHQTVPLAGRKRSGE